MLETLDIQQLWHSALAWGRSLFWNENNLFQIGIAITVFITANVFYRLVRGPIVAALQSRGLPFRSRKILENLTRQIFPLSALLLIFIAKIVASADFFALETGIFDGLMKVLLAWIVIRISLQFIENSLVRNIFAVGIWLVAALSIFGFLEHTTRTLDAIGFNIGDLRLSALAVVKAAFSIFILLYLASFASQFAEKRILKITSLRRSSRVLIAKITRITLIVFALLIAVTSAGIDLSLFAVFSGAIGLGIGFGLQKVVSNLFSGLLLLMDKSIEPGDVLELESGMFGWVDHMGARYTEVITRDNKSYLIPNEDFITQRVVNWSHGNTLIRQQVLFGVDYKADPHLVKKIAEAAAAIPERVVEDPPAVCWLVEFGDSSLNFSLRFWIKDAEQGVTNVKGEVMMALWDAFKEHGIEIPYPHREIYLHEPPEKKKTAPKKKTES